MDQTLQSEDRDRQNEWKEKPWSNYMMSVRDTLDLKAQMKHKRK